MRKHRSRAGNVRGNVVNARVKERIIGQVAEDVFLVKPGYIAATKLVFLCNRNRWCWQQFLNFCKRHDLQWKFPQKGTPQAEQWRERHDDGELGDLLPDPPDRKRPRDFEVAVEVSGRLEFLALMVRKCWVNKWEDCLDVGAPRITV